MRHAQGYATIIDPDRPLGEYDTITCAHCGTIIFTKPNSVSTTYLIQQRTPEGLLLWVEEAGAGCWTCGGKPVCLPCHDKGTCLPLEKWLDQQERRGGYA